MKAFRLIFVYNAEGNLFSRLTDFAHKIVSPSTYDCKLCSLTYGNFTVRQEWSNFLGSLPIECEFLYKEEFAAIYSVKAELPAVYSATGVKELISASEINACGSLEELKKLVREKLENAN